jgi:hypothetical protein
MPLGVMVFKETQKNNGGRMGFIKGFGLVSGVCFLSGIIATASLADQRSDFINSCTMTNKVSTSKILCKLQSGDGNGELQFLMTTGSNIKVAGTGRYSKIHTQVGVAETKYLGPRLSDVGALDTSVEFVGRSGGTIVTIDIPCGQSFYAAVGFAENMKGNGAPPEWSAQCVLQ